MTQGASSEATGASSGVVQEVQQKAGQAVGEARSVADQVTGQAKEQAASLMETQKGRLADQLVTVADVLRQTSQGLQGQEQAAIRKYVDRAAEQVERATNYLRDSDVQSMLGDTQALAQRRPGIFLAGSLALGMAGARFLMSSGRRAREAQYGTSGTASGASYPRDGWSTSNVDGEGSTGADLEAEYGAAGTSYGDIRSPGA